MRFAQGIARAEVVAPVPARNTATLAGVGKLHCRKQQPTQNERTFCVQQSSPTATQILRPRVTEVRQSVSGPKICDLAAGWAWLQGWAAWACALAPAAHPRHGGCVHASSLHLETKVSV